MSEHILPFNIKYYYLNNLLKYKFCVSSDDIGGELLPGETINDDSLLVSEFFSLLMKINQCQKWEYGNLQVCIMIFIIDEYNKYLYFT